MRTCRTEILVNVNSRRRCYLGNVPPSLSPSSPPLSLRRSAPSFFLSRTYAGIYVALSSRELSKGNLLADNGNTSQRVSTRSFRNTRFTSKQAEPKCIMPPLPDTNLVLNGHVPSRYNVPIPFFLSPSIVLRSSSNRESTVKVHEHGFLARLTTCECKLKRDETSKANVA